MNRTNEKLTILHVAGLSNKRKLIKSKINFALPLILYNYFICENNRNFRHLMCKSFCFVVSI